MEEAETIAEAAVPTPAFYKDGYDAVALRLQLLQSQFVGDASITQNGGRIIVTVLPSVIPEIFKTNGDDITAPFAGEILQITVKNGYTEKKAGQLVKQGDVIIKGDKTAATGTVLIKGVIQMHTFYGETQIVNNKETQTDFLGNYEELKLKEQEKIKRQFPYTINSFEQQYKQTNGGYVLSTYATAYCIVA
jgi:biotin carboxyl carrier protein